MLVNTGLLEATVGANTIHAATSITNNSGATLEVTGSGVTLTIDAAISFTNTGELLATAGGELILIGDTVTDASGTVEVDANSTFDLQTTTFNNGTFVNSGLLEATVGANAIDSATSITNNGGATLEVTGSGVTLTIDAATTFTNTGELLATAGGELILFDDLVTNTGGVITVDGTGILDLTGGVTINNGQLNDDSGGQINVSNAGNEIENETGASAIGSGTNSFTNAGTLTVLAGGTLTLLDDLVTNTGGVITVDASGTLDLTGGDTIDNGQLNKAGSINVSGSGNKIENESGLATIGSGTNSFTNTGTLTVLAGGTLTLLDDLVTNTGGVITVDGTGILDLTGGDTINNGQLNDDSGGQINVSNAGNEIENETGASAIGSGTNSFTNAGTLTVLARRHADAARRPGDQHRRGDHG